MNTMFGSRKLLLATLLGTTMRHAYGREMGVRADSYLGGPTGHAQTLVTPKSAFERAFLADIESTLGRGHRTAIAQRLAEAEEFLKPIFAAMPVDDKQRLGRKAALYTLHRVFTRRRAWTIQGLETVAQTEAGQLQNVALLKDRAPHAALKRLERQLLQPGLDLREFALVVATVEQFVADDAVEALQVVYQAHQKDPRGAVSPKEADQLLTTYMSSYILGENVSALSIKEILDNRMSVEERFPAWDGAVQFLRDATNRTLSKHSPTQVRFADLVQAVERFGEVFGTFEASECNKLRGRLLGAEEQPGNGRVRVANFYAAGLQDNDWQFSESANYLRAVGALDESDSDHGPRILIANYMAGRANCLAESSHLAVCCSDPCDVLWNHLEQQLRASEASPAAIVGVLAKWSNEGTTPSVLLELLEDVARRHHGYVPLHGRLFSQWLHFMFPRECPYPHEAGTIRPMAAEEYEATTGQDSSATEEEMLQFVATLDKDGNCSSSGSTANTNSFETGDVRTTLLSGMWTSAEELITMPRAPAGGTSFGTTAAAPHFAWFSIAGTARVLRILMGVVLLITFSSSIFGHAIRLRALVGEVLTAGSRALPQPKQAGSNGHAYHL